ncbi:CoA pyrophosphatase [Proteinivorax hydrogeniformans]|uniref:CoA pyrophosphatase n=1 Tax=Proteinivorax hydrogeniformans TaxID=1826727 RepID=A0AAU8HVV4_9FIRM
MKVDITNVVAPFLDNRPKPLDTKKEFSIVVPIFVWEGKMSFLFQVRSMNLSRQPGQICFPGGALELKETIKEGAIRETCEELGLDKKDVKVVGQLDFLASPYNTVLYPFLALIYKNPQTLNINKDEVSSVFTIELNEALRLTPQLSVMDVKPLPKNDFPYELVDKNKNYNWSHGDYPIYFYQYQDKVIWGFTARIFKDVLDKIKAEKNL